MPVLIPSLQPASENFLLRKCTCPVSLECKKDFNPSGLKPLSLALLAGCQKLRESFILSEKWALNWVSEAHELLSKESIDYWLQIPLHLLLLNISRTWFLVPLAVEIFTFEIWDATKHNTWKDLRTLKTKQGIGISLTISIQHKLFKSVTQHMERIWISNSIFTHKM